MSSTVLHRLNDWATATPLAPAQRTRVGGVWKALSAKEYNDRVFHLALFLEARGLKPGEITAILGYNCAEWVHLELATMLVRGNSAGLYPNSTANDIQYVLTHTGATVLGVQNEAHYLKIIAEGQTVPAAIRLIISFDGETKFDSRAVAYSDALAEGKKIAESKSVAEYLGRLDPFAPAFMVYTSGTTGNPKGAVLSHDNLTFTSDQIAKRWKLPYAGDGSLFSFLPLCHIAEKLHSIGVGITQRYVVSYCTKFDNVMIELGEVQPQLLLCVPRVWEKMMEGVTAKVQKAKGVKGALSRWALGVGKRYHTAKLLRQAPAPADVIAYPIAEKLVLSKVRAALGLGRAALLASGAAPLPVHVSRWFLGIGLEILECYGLTESTGMISITIPKADCAGTVGKPLEGCEFKLAPDGEICSKGRHIFLGYFHDEVNTKATLTEGWLMTGDLGEWTNAGLLKIVGRKKDIMKTSGGKMVAPVPIEEKLKESDVISQVCLVGDNRKYFSALITLSDAALHDVKAKGAPAIKDGTVVDATILKSVQAQFDRVNKTLASFEQVKRFTVLDREFSIENGEMTPTMKMKRNVIEQRFRAVVDSMYAG